MRKFRITYFKHDTFTFCIKEIEMNSIGGIASKWRELDGCVNIHCIRYIEIVPTWQD